MICIFLPAPGMIRQLGACVALPPRRQEGQIQDNNGPAVAKRPVA